jgi:hypothetical protein
VHDPYFGTFVGFDPEAVRFLREGLTSKRKTVVVLLDDARPTAASFASKVLERAADALSSFEVLVYPRSRWKELQGRGTLRTRPARWLCDLDMLADLGRARVVVGFDLADWRDAPMVEAMGMGAFPIEVGAMGLNAWLTGSRGAAVSGTDVEAAAARIAQASIDDGLVDRAAAINTAYFDATYAPAVVQKRARELYQRFTPVHTG